MTAAVLRRLHRLPFPPPPAFWDLVSAAALIAGLVVHALSR